LDELLPGGPEGTAEETAAQAGKSGDGQGQNLTLIDRLRNVSGAAADC
jgi:hypothetical protein